MTRIQRGFTLIELMIVVAIPAYQDYATRAKVSKAISMASQVNASVSEAYISIGSLPATNAEAGLPAKTEITSTYVESADVSNGVITIAIQGTEVAALDAGSLVFEPSTSNQNLTWSCRASSSGLNQYVPADCRVTL